MKKIRYDRVFITIMIFIVIVFVFIYLAMNRSRVYEYEGNIDTYTGTYRQDDKIYTFDLKAFVLDVEYYVSLNDMYNIMVILDKDTKVYLDYDKHTMTYMMSDMTYYFDFGHDKIMSKNETIDLQKNDTHIYISHKNVYLSVSFIEKILLKNEKSIQFENANAIIQ